MLTLPAPAKINLFLNILGRRSDGYHELQTLFQLLDYGDELSFEVLPQSIIELHDETTGVPPDQNLIVKAACRLQEATGCRQGARIILHKKLPAGGGLGGGSSDAATTLLALNALWRTGLSLNELATLGARLGADVPVFVLGKSAWAEGIGDKLQALELPEKWFVVLHPGCNVSTAAIFTHPELTRDKAAITVAAFFEQGAENACQGLVEKLYPPVAEAINWLEKHAANHSGTAQMTGTGACVFATLDSESSARKILADSPWSGFIAKGLNQSPVHALLPN